MFDLYKKIVDPVDKGNYACSVFLDFAKVFDIADHRILPSNLLNYGIREIAKYWFESHLTIRKQVIEISNILSKEKFITWSVTK